MVKVEEWNKTKKKLSRQQNFKITQITFSRGVLVRRPIKIYKIDECFEDDFEIYLLIKFCYLKDERAELSLFGIICFNLKPWTICKVETQWIE